MFGDDSTGQMQDNGVVAPLDPSVMSSQAPALADDSVAPSEDHTMTPAYPADDVSQVPAENPVLQMHQDAVAASPAGGAPVVSADSAPATDAHDDELLAIKQDALTALTPLVGNLEQSAEEKFRTTMMLIQASDDRTLVRQAYEAAQAITDEKIKAQALLDVVNEINYFTSHSA